MRCNAPRSNHQEDQKEPLKGGGGEPWKLEVEDKNEIESRMNGGAPATVGQVCLCGQWGWKRGWEREGREEEGGEGKGGGVF